jgi:hypothetical protein
MPKAKIAKRSRRFHPYPKEARDVIQRITSNINKDGYLYCIKVQLGGQDVVKIGKTHMKINESDDSVITRLTRRYHTYYPSFDMMHYIRVLDVHNAESQLFDLLTDIRVSGTNEHFYYVPDRVDDAFRVIKALFPSLDTLITKLDTNTLTALNTEIRLKELDDSM